MEPFYDYSIAIWNSENMAVAAELIWIIYVAIFPRWVYDFFLGWL